MLTVVEGPDGAGKTTLVNRLTSRWAQHHGPLRDPFRTYLHDLALAPHGTVLDRFYPSEQVYGPVLRGKDLIGSVKARMLNRVLLSRQAVLVKCLPRRETCKAAWGSRLVDEYVQAGEAYDQIYAGYAKLEVDLPTVVYDWETLDFVDFMRALHAARPPINRGPGVGCFKPGNVLLVGEQATVDAPYDFPFVHDKGCSPWLAEQLDLAGISEQGLYWVNALDRLGRPTDQDFVAQLQPRAIVALGDTAGRWCASLGHPYEQVPHPQYWRRFKARDDYPLLEVLREQL